jgi:hypothetical protein
MSSIFEVLMLLCFAVSWPFNIRASYKARTARFKSVMFEVIVEIGYVFGMLNKVVNDSVNYVFAFYILDFVLVAIDLCLYVRNRHIDALRDRGASREGA